MKLMRCFTICSCFIFLVGCNKYDNEDIAAIVRGQEITVGDIRFMNGASDEKLPELVAGIVKQELIIQEAKEMGLDVTEEIEEMLFGMGELPPENTDSKSAKNTREFELSQAKKLEMEPEEYYKEYAKLNVEISAYINAYVEAKFGEPNNERDNEEYMEKVNNELDNVVQQYQNEIEIFIKPEADN